MSVDHIELDVSILCIGMYGCPQCEPGRYFIDSKRPRLA